MSAISRLDHLAIAEVGDHRLIDPYRIIYELRDDTAVRVVAIRHRAAAYVTDPR